MALADLKTRLLTTALETLQVGAVLVDIDGVVLDANRCAEAVLERRGGLRLEGRRLCAEEAEDAAVLKRLVSEAAGDVKGSPARTAHVLAISRGEGAAPIVAFVTPIRSTPGGAPWQKQGATLVLLSDPSELPMLSIEALRHLYGLTPAEACVAAPIARGSGVAETAAALDVSVSTVRAQLQQVFAKTDTRRQMELVRLLLTGPGAPGSLGVPVA